MRLFSLLLLSAFPFALHAETIEAPSRVDRVILYPWGASVIRVVEITAPAGVHDLVIPDLPQDTPAEALRVAAPEGVAIGAVNLATGRLPVTEDRKSPQVAAAEAEVERLEGVIRDRDAAIAAIRLRIDAAEEQVAFLRGLGQGKAAEGLSARAVEELRALSRMVGDEVLAALGTAHQAEQEAQAAERAKKDDLEALERARQALAALVAEGADKAVLTLAVETNGGAATLEVTTFTDAASWQPVYDLRLARAGTPALDIDRGVLVAQETGEDWTGVELTLSTARPADQSAPSELYPWLRRIESEEAMPAAEGVTFRGAGDAMVSTFAEPEMAPAPVVEKASLEMMGATVTYRYPTRVDIRDGVEALRLKLDTLSLTPEIRAVAVPARDATAFLVATLTNTSPEVILPGEAMFYLDGALTGAGALPLTAAGGEAELGFGPIDGLRLTRTVPERSEGDRGMISKTNRIDEVAILKVENLTGEAWPLRVIDQVPYSEQDDLRITYRATPPVTEADVDGKRGLLAWEFDLGPGATREIRLEHSLTWPAGYVLR